MRIVCILLFGLAAAAYVLLATEAGGNLRQLIFGSSAQQQIDDGLEVYLWNEEDAPGYVLPSSPARIDWTLPEDSIEYLELDGLGRATGVRANLTHATVLAVQERREQEDADSKAEERLRLKPSGWGSNEQVDIVCPDGHVYYGWFWNRSHLLADSLGGEMRLENIVCGTRMQNVGSNTEEDPGGMAWCESEARVWLWHHSSGSLLFSAVPVYNGDDPVPLAVVVDMRSSDGEVDIHAIVFNAAKGYAIDYSTGEFRSV